MSKSGGIKASSLLVGMLLCMAVMQTAIAQQESNEQINSASMENVIVGNSTNTIEPQFYSTYLTAGSVNIFTVMFTNTGNETLVLIPKVVAVPNSEKNIDESWIKTSPTNVTVAPGSTQKFDVEIDVPRDTESGSYQGSIAFTDDLVPNSNQYVNSMRLDLSVQGLSKIQLETQYISDTIEAGKEYEYQIKLKNMATKDVTIDPKIPEYSNYYDPSYIPAFGSDAIGISAPSIIKAGETANMTIKVKVPENATGRYYGTISMNVDGVVTTDFTSNPQLNLDLSVLKQPLVPYVKTFKTTNKKPITVEVNGYTNENPWLISPKREKASFELKMRYNHKRVKMTFVKSVESSSIGIVGSYPLVWPIDDKSIYQNYGSTFVETYTAPGAVGDWELSILPKNTQSFGYSITVGDSKLNKP
jgi:uncharacterized membrane protein